MSALNFDQAWQAVQTLTPRQQQRLRKLLEALRFMHQPLTPEEQLQLLLLKDGVIDHVPRPLTEAERQAFQEYKPVPIEGKPLSETIIEERRLAARQQLEARNQASSLASNPSVNGTPVLYSVQPPSCPEQHREQEGTFRTNFS